MGAGRLDLTHAMDPGVILDPPSLGFGRVTMGMTDTMTVTVTSVAAASETYAVSTLDTRGGFTGTTTLAGVTVTPPTLTLAPGASGQVVVKWDTTATSGPGDQQGFVVLDGPTHDAHFPVWVRVGYAPDAQVGKVLLIDNDASQTLDLTDYTHYYTETLKALNISYDVWDADANFNHPMTIPDANYLAQYDAVILQTGDNYQPNGTFTVATPLTQLDQDALTEYANESGPILAFGQDLSGVLGAPSNPTFLFSATLNAKRLQDSINADTVFSTTAQLLTGVPRSPYQDMNFDISDRGDGAGNQAYIDELAAACFDPDTADYCAQSTPLLQYGIRGNDKGSGYVALATNERVTLERPGVISKSKTMVFGFGLEGVNDNTGFSTREDLLGTALRWAWDKPTVTITATTDQVGGLTRFKAAISSEFGGKGVSYRWDFGDGTGFTNPYPNPEAGHTYAKPGRYHVRVEVTNEMGTTVIGEQTITVGPAVFLPLIRR